MGDSPRKKSAGGHGRSQPLHAPAAGAPVLYAHAVGGRAQDACAARAWRHEKRSAETAARWLRARGRAAAADRARAACYAARRPSRDYQNR